MKILLTGNATVILDKFQYVAKSSDLLQDGASLSRDLGLKFNRQVTSIIKSSDITPNTRRRITPMNLNHLNYLSQLYFQNPKYRAHTLKKYAENTPSHMLNFTHILKVITDISIGDGDLLVGFDITLLLPISWL